MKAIIFIKDADICNRKKGEIVNFSDTSADNIVSQGFAEYVDSITPKDFVEMVDDKLKKTKEKKDVVFTYNIAKQILDRWATQVLPKSAIYLKEGISTPNQLKNCHYEERGYIGDEVLWLAPINCLRIEFEDTPENNHKYILAIESNVKALGFDYCITSHGGKSDYFNIFNIKNIPMGEDNKTAKILLVDYIMPEMVKKHLDKTNLGWTLTPVIEHEHWKNKYNGKIHKIIRGKNPIEHNNIYPKKLLKQIDKQKHFTDKCSIDWKQNDIWIEKFLLDYCCSHKLPEGNRHNVICKNLGILIAFRDDKDIVMKQYQQSQQNMKNEVIGWVMDTINGKYNNIGVGEIINYIKENNLDFKIPDRKDQVEQERTKFRIDNYKTNAEMLSQLQPFFYDNNNNYWIWSNNKWKIVDETDILLIIEKCLSLFGSLVNSKVKNNYLEAIRQVGRTKLPRDVNKNSIQFKNTIFNIKDKSIIKVTSEYFCTNPIEWELGNNEETPTMDKLFEEWVGKEYVQTLYEILAYCCLLNYPIHRIFCFVGSGCNGKSQFLKVVNKFIGNDNVSSTELDTLLDSRFESIKLYKKLVCTMGETNFGTMNKTSLIKRLSGQDLIGFEFKGKKPFDDFNYAKIIIATNSLPITNDTSDGFWRRWMIIDFPNRFKEGNEVYLNIPDIEFNNLALKITKILPNLLENGMFTNEGSIEERQQRYIMASNPLPLFIDSCCERTVGSFIKFNDLYNAYISFLMHFRRRVPKYKEFKELLILEGFSSDKSTKTFGEGDYKEYVNGYFIDHLSLRSNIETIYANYANYASFLTQLREEDILSGKIQHNKHKKHKFDEKVENQAHLEEIDLRDEKEAHLGDIDKNPHSPYEIEVKQNISTITPIKFDEKSQVWHKCCQCNESPCNEAEDGKFYCKSCFESMQTERHINK